MALAVCLLLDGRSERLVRQLWSRMDALGARSLASHTHGRHHPHLSYAVLRTWDLEPVRRTLGAIPDGGPVPLSCQGALLFPRGRVALAPALPADVVQRQNRVVEALAPTGADLHRHYRPGRWVPHVSLATRTPPTALPAVAAAIADVVPLDLTADRAALVDSGTGQVWPLPTIP